MAAPAPSPFPVLALVLSLAACGGGREAGPRWLALADGFTPRAAPAGARPWVPAAGDQDALELLPPAGPGAPPGCWLRARLPASAWHRQPGTPIWSARRPIALEGAPDAEGTRPRLTAGGRGYAYVPFSKVHDLSNLPQVVFSVGGERVYAVTEAPERSPGDAVLEERIDPGAAVGGTWRVKVGRYYADGIPVLPGFREELACDVPPGSVLRFGTAGVCRTADDGTPAGHLRWRVLADGREIFAEERAAGAEALAAQHAVPLPVDGGRLRLAFEVTGDAGLAAFLTPVVGPSSIGTYGARPWKEGHPDVVLFLADTFRADNMALYGGDPALTPSLDRFAAGALRFLRARSTSTWTLPSHAAMFSGLYPYQSDVHTGRSRLPDEAVTIAEQLRAAGYRTGAVTDQGFVNSSFGLAQGFDRFDEEWSDFDRTLEGVREFLDADDGRPAFLFVHTYRTHVPYVVSAATRARLGEHLGLPADVDYDSLQAAIARIPPDLDPDAVPPGEIARTVHDVVALYRGTAADLDADFEELRGALEARGLLQGGALIFTSDHGEGVFEHGTAGHGRWMWEGNVRIPLLIRWKGAPPGDVALGASNVDLPRTIAAIAGVPPAAGWQGANLLALDEDRPTPTYQCLEDGSPSLLAVVEDGRKLIAPADPAAVGAAEVRQAYDLGHDPGERADAVASGAAWPRERLRALAPWLLPTLEPRLSAGGAELAPEELERLRALGYAGAH